MKNYYVYPRVSPRVLQFERDSSLCLLKKNYKFLAYASKNRFFQKKNLKFLPKHEAYVVFQDVKFHKNRQSQRGMEPKLKKPNVTYIDNPVL